MAMITDASLASETEAEGLAFAPRCCGSRPRPWSACASGWVIRSRRAADLILSLVGERDRYRDGQGGAGGPEAGGDAGLDRHPGLSTPSGRGGARRLGPDPCRRRGDRTVAERRDRRSRCG